MIAPVRTARRAIKRDPPPDAQAAQALRKQILALELELEYIEQSMLTNLAAQWPQSVRRGAPRDTVEANLRRYLELLGFAPQPTHAAHLARIADACCGLAVAVR